MVAGGNVQHWPLRKGALRARHAAAPSNHARALPGSPHPVLERPRASLKPPHPAQTAAERAQPIASESDIANLAQIGQVVFYRLSGDPSFALIYISQNITKYGHDRAALLASPSWIRELVDPDDLSRVDAAMARVLDKQVENASIEFRLRTRDGAQRYVENRYVPVRDGDGRLIEVEAVMIDITERTATARKLARAARSDPLTGLASQATFVERLRHAFDATRRGAMPFAILHLGIDRPGEINGTLGRPADDHLLRETARRIACSMRATDLVARLAHDEFLVLQHDTREPADAAAFATRLQSVLAAPCSINGADVQISASIGICPYVDDRCRAKALLARAAAALAHAKRAGRGHYRFYTDELDQQVRERITLADDLRHALEHGELELHYQPEVELSSGNIVGMEGLVRWRHPSRGLLSPRVFMPIAERTDAVMAELGHWVLDQACQQMRAWHDEGVAPQMIAINLSLFELESGQAFVSRVAETAAKWRLAPSELEFDVTEAMLARLAWSQSDVLAQLHTLGAKLAIDDFGGEYASFDYVKAYRVNYLKLAQSLIRRSTNDPESAAMIRAIAKLAHDLGIWVIGQGVETEAQRALLADTNRAAKAQGFHFSQAVSAAQASELLRVGHIATAAVASGAPDR